MGRGAYPPYDRPAPNQRTNQRTGHYEKGGKLHTCKEKGRRNDSSLSLSLSLLFFPVPFLRFPFGHLGRRAAVRGRCRYNTPSGSTERDQKTQKVFFQLQGGEAKFWPPKRDRWRFQLGLIRVKFLQSGGQQSRVIFVPNPHQERVFKERRYSVQIKWGALKS